jgi:hypothetical protein
MRWVATINSGVVVGVICDHVVRLGVLVVVLVLSVVIWGVVDNVSSVVVLLH